MTAPDLSPLAVVDGGAAAGHPADRPVLQLQLQLPVVHRQHDPRAILVTSGEKDHALGVVGAEVKLCGKAGRERGEEGGVRSASGLGRRDIKTRCSHPVGIFRRKRSLTIGTPLNMRPR